MQRTITAAIREFRATALTKAFIFGAIVFPLLIWGVLIAVTAIEFKKPPMEGVLVVADRTAGGRVGEALSRYFDPQEQKRRLEEMRKQLEVARALAESMGVPKQQIEKGMQKAEEMLGGGEDDRVSVELLPADGDEQRARDRAQRGEALALVIVDETTMALAPEMLRPMSAERDHAAPREGPGTYTFVHGTKLRPDHGSKLKRAVEDTVRDERYRRAGMDPTLATALSRLPVTARSIVVTPSGEKKSSEALTVMLPFIFMMLIYVAAMTGGQYLMMGTLEEKSSRVMEVILSAVSAMELMIGKMIGQGCVGLSVLAIYATLGWAVAGRFGVSAQIPTDVIPWALLYFLMAYGLIGAMMLAVGSAVTEIREAQALYTPITITVILPFLLMFPIMQNPASVIARVFSYFPLTTPYVMVMRLAQPSHPVPLWELILTTVIGGAGVAAVVWAAAKIFRVGVLMYGKPPSLMGLVKWVRYA